MKARLVILCVVVPVLALAGTSFATTTWTVSAAGGADFITIKDAITAASDGDTINVAAGTYHNDIVDGHWDGGTWVYDHRISKSLIINGAQAGVDPQGGTSRGTETILTRSDGLPYSITAPNVQLNGFMIGNSNANTGGRVILGDDADGTSVSNCIIQNTPNASSGHGVMVYPDATNVLIANNTFSNTSWESIRFEGQGVISDNVIGAPSTNDGIAVYGSAIITGNDISGAGYAGIWLVASGFDVVIQGNTIHDNYYGIDVGGAWWIIPDGDVDVSGYSVNGNNILDNTPWGIESLAFNGMLDATGNWWGDPTGPTHSGNPGGTGDAVSDYVDYGNFLAAPIPEPVTMLGVFLGVSGIGAYLRKRTKAAA